MAAKGVFKIPREFRDEDKWFRYFNKKQAIVLVLMLILDYRIIMAASTKNLVIPAILFSLVITITTVGVVMIQLPVEVMFLTGGGITLDQWILRVILRKTKRFVYTKNTWEGSQD